MSGRNDHDCIDYGRIGSEKRFYLCPLSPFQFHSEKDMPYEFLLPKHTRKGKKVPFLPSDHSATSDVGKSLFFYGVLPVARF